MRPPEGGRTLYLSLRKLCRFAQQLDVRARGGERGERLRGVLRDNQKLRHIRLLNGKLGGNRLLRAREDRKIGDAILLPRREQGKERFRVQSAAERVVRLEKRSRDILAVFCNRHTENVPCGIELSRKRRVCRQLGGSQEKRAAKIGLFRRYLPSFPRS